jgi:hypothetical protein
LGTLATLAFVRPAYAQPPTPELLQHLAGQANTFEAMRAHASYLLHAELDRLDGDGHADNVKRMEARVEGDGKDQHVVILRFTDDGEDTTVEERKKQHEKEEDAKKGKKDPHLLKNPFLAEQQGRYVFDVAETDRADPSRVRVTFVPKEPADDTMEGSLWVDAKTGRPFSAGFKVSKPGMFIDYLHVTMELGADTPMGPAVSRMTVEGKGGILFLRKHFRGTATLTDYRITP